MATKYENASILRREVSGELPNVPNPVVDIEIAQSVRELCDRVALFQATGSVTAANRVLLLDAIEDDDSEVVRVMPRGVSLAGAQLPQYVRPNPASDQPLGFYVRSRRELLLTKEPPTGAFSVTAQMRPVIDTRNVPADVAHDYHDTIVHGALSRLYRKAGAVWTSPDAAAEHWKLFESGINRIRSEVNRIHTDA